MHPFLVTRPTCSTSLIILALLFVLLSPTSSAPLSSTSPKFANPSNNSHAGLEKTASRVINGQPVTDKSEYPFVVDLSYNNLAISSSRFCTATLIAPNIVLTAAHCVLNDGYRPAVYATIGRIELDDNHADNDKAKTFRTIASIVHPRYEGLGSPSDVALMLLNSSSQAPNVHLADRTPNTDDVAWVVGYGVQMMGTVERSSRPIEVMSGRLQKTALSIMDKEFCSSSENGIETAPGMLCTAGVKKGSSACKGDSGGGLFLKTTRQASSGSKDDRVVQVGIVSYGDARCSSEESGVFTDVASVKEWIQSSMERLQALSLIGGKLQGKTPRKNGHSGSTKGKIKILVPDLESKAKYRDPRGH